MLYRTGRITSSNCKKACTMTIENPAPSTVNLIMQYNDRVNTPAMRHGKTSEPKAFKKYSNILKNLHTNFSVHNAGLHINSKFPFFGASPYGLTECECHGKGLLEIKCPFSFKKGLEGYRDHKNCPVDKQGVMKKNHKYFFQIQLQMLVTETNHCDFFVWTEGEKPDDNVLIRVKKDDQLCKKLVEKLEKVFMRVLLPELVTRKKDPHNTKDMKTYCYCKRPYYNLMIACDNSKCKIEWYHYACVSIVRTPAENKQWYCPDCKNVNKRGKQKKNK